MPEQMIAFARARHIPYLKTSAIQDTPQFQVGPCAVNSMNTPFQGRKSLSAGVALGERRQRRQHPLAASINVGQLQDEYIPGDPESAQQLSSPGADD